MTQDQVIQALRKSIGTERQRAWCEKAGVHETVLSDVLNRNRPPTTQLCAIVGVERVVEKTITYRKVSA